MHSRERTGIPGFHAPRLTTTVVGFILLLAAYSKLLAFFRGGEYSSPLVVFMTPRFFLIAAAVEACVAAWVFSGYLPKLAWLTSLSMFCVFSIISCYAGILGLNSCGCFGSISVSPWATLVVDVGVVCMLTAMCLPARRRARGGYSGSYAWCMRIMVMVSSIVAAGILVLIAVPGSIHVFCARLRGERFCVDAPFVDLGSGRCGDQRQVDVAIHNFSDEAIRLLGASSSCGCEIRTTLPVTVQPHSLVPVRMRVTYPNTTGRFRREYSLYIDEADNLEIRAQIAGLVVAVDQR